MENLDWSDPEGIRSVIWDFEEVDVRAPRAAAHRSSGQARPQVFIGKKSPVTKSENLAVVGGNYRVGRCDRFGLRYRSQVHGLCESDQNF